MMAIPIRIQRKRTKGWKMQAASPNGLPVIYVGRPTIWGNPFKAGYHEYGGITKVWSYQDIVSLYAQEINVIAENHILSLKQFLEPLRGKHLCCWCDLYDDRGIRIPCHADVLLREANR